MKTIIIVGAASIVSLAAGAAGGYLLAKKRLEEHYVEIAEQEIAEAKAYYSRMYKKDEYADPVELARSIENDIERSVAENVAEEVVRTIISDQGYIPDPEPRVLSPEALEAELMDRSITEARDNHKPYVIDREDWFDSEVDYEQITLRYFEAEDLLVGSDKSVLEDIDGTVGLENLGRFGVKSGDNTVVYIRNDEHEVDYELVLDKGNYARDMLGYIEHSDNNRVRKFRDYE